MPRIFDNIQDKLLPALIESIEVSYRSDFCVGYFNLRGWREIADKIEKYSGDEQKKCRILIGMQEEPEEIISQYFMSKNKNIDNKTVNQLKKDIALRFKQQLTIGLPNEDDEKGLRKLSKQIKDGKVVVKLFLKHKLHAKLYLSFRNDNFNPIIGFVGSSNLTMHGLSDQGELNVDVIEQDAAEKLARWFEDRWNDRWCIDISDELSKIIDNSWASEIRPLPYYIYLKIAYHLSQEARAGLSEFKIPRSFQNDLLEFQQKAVLIASHHLNKRDGVIIGDVVGLGKTIIACAIAKIFEDDFNLETLIICPKNITQMWEQYIHRYQLRAKVLSMSLVQNNLPNLLRYRIVIIDESHNLRNREGVKYNIIREYISKNASKVILLSATPYNKSYLDLSNQLRLFIDEDMDLGIAPEKFIRSIGGIVEFQSRYQYSERTLPAFEKSDYSDDWRELMRLYLVRRTRSFIKDNYAFYDDIKNKKYLLFSDGTRSYFPDRIPKKIEYSFNPKNHQDQYAKLYSGKVIDKLNLLYLPRYGLANYIKDSPSIKLSDEEETIKSNLSRASRKLMGFARTNLFKRLESSGYAFLLSIIRHILRNYIYIYALENNLSIPVGGQEANLLDEYLEDMDYDNPDDSGKNNSLPLKNNSLPLLKELKENDFQIQAKKIYEKFFKEKYNSFDWFRAEFFKDDLVNHIKSDSKNLLDILKIGGSWDPKKDKQINALYEVCTKNHPSEKIIIFTQFADTAYYLFNELKSRGLQQIEYVTGDSDNPTDIATRFSPISNNAKEIKGTNSEIRILISTDVLSEGQNLQDCHIILNYDLPWAIIRLIQRTGRVDRIGQQSDNIICYYFLPEDGIEKIIKLRERLSERIKQNAEVIGSDETFFDGDPVNENYLHNLYNENAGILDDEDDSEVDLASYAFQIWKNAINNNPELEKIIPSLPNVVYSTKKENRGEGNNEGVIVYARTCEDNDALVMVDKDGKLITQSQYAILKKAECNPDEEAIDKIPNHHQLVANGLEYINVSEKQIGGQLGKKTGARYKVYTRLTEFYKNNKGSSLFANDKLKKVIEDIYRYPLREYAKETLNRQMRAGIDDLQLLKIVISLSEEDKLCIIKEEEKEKKNTQIICSMGLRYECK